MKVNLERLLVCDVDGKVDRRKFVRRYQTDRQVLRVNLYALGNCA